MRVRRLSALLGSAALVAIGLAAPVAAAPPGELAPGAHPAASSQASDRVVYSYDRSTSADHAAKPQRPGSSPNMTYHGGPVLSSPTVTETIFWGPSWADANFAGDKITGLDQWYTGFGNSGYARTTTEYTDGSGAHVSPATSFGGHHFDPSQASGGGSTSAILAEVARVITSPTPNGYYAVYTDLPRGHAGYCAWHSSGTANGQPVEFAFFWKLDGDPGCDPQDTSGLHSQGLAALANVSGHELAESMTDPSMSSGAWYDGQGYENGDKCAWVFSVPVTLGGSQWKIQGEWSNGAYTAGTGYPNSKGQLGCLYSS